MKKIIVLITCLMLPAGAFAQELYTWLDDDGTRHYSTTPPTDYEYELVGSANEIMLDPETLRAREEAQAQAEAEAEEETEEAERGDDGLTDEERAQACTEIDSQLNLYEERLTGGEAGMEDEQLQAELAAMQEVRTRLQEHCE